MVLGKRQRVCSLHRPLQASLSASQGGMGDISVHLGLCFFGGVSWVPWASFQTSALEPMFPARAVRQTHPSSSFMKGHHWSGEGYVRESCPSPHLCLLSLENSALPLCYRVGSQICFRLCRLMQVSNLRI